jgi:hypothetical protein
MSRNAYGIEISNSQWFPLRSVIAEPETTISGNLVLRVGRENGGDSTAWHITEHVVLTPEEAREYIAKLATLLPDSGAFRPLPRVAVHDVTDVGAVLIAEFYGHSALSRAEALVDELVNSPGGGGKDYSMDVSDDRCGDCGRMFSSEARVETDDGWVCPVCGGDPKVESKND